MRVEEVFGLASSEIGVLSFRFTNTGSDFLHIDRVVLGFGDKKTTESLSVLSGSDLESWADAIDTRNRERRYARDAAILGLAIGADILAGAAALARSKPLPPPEATGFAVAATALDRESVVLAPYPEAYVLATPFGVPPNLGVSRWVALQTRDQGTCVHFVSLSAYVRERGWLQFATEFRGPRSPSEWQKRRCSSPSSAPSSDAW